MVSAMPKITPWLLHAKSLLWMHVYHCIVLHSNGCLCISTILVFRSFWILDILSHCSLLKPAAKMLVHSSVLPTYLLQRGLLQCPWPSLQILFQSNTSVLGWGSVISNAIPFSVLTIAHFLWNPSHVMAIHLLCRQGPVESSPLMMCFLPWSSAILVGAPFGG